MRIEDAIECALNGEAVLFLGAGFSIGSQNLQGNSMPTASQFASRIAQLVGIEADAPLEDASEEFLSKFGSMELCKTLVAEFTAKKVSKAQERVAKLPWFRVYTTNYDDVFEKARSAVGEPLTAVTLADDPRLFSATQLLSVHLNGFVGNLAGDKLVGELKLTDTSYLSAAVADSVWATKFRQDVRRARAVVFIGYSMADLDIARLFYETQRIKEKTFFVVGPKPSARIQRRLPRFGSVYNISVEEFAEKVLQVKEYFIARDDDDQFLSIAEYSHPESAGEISDNDLIDLFLFGRYSWEKIATSFLDEKRYYCMRRIVENVCSELSNEAQCVCLTSELGNGKTLCCEGLKLRLLEEGFRVFELREQVESTLTEVAKLSAAPGRKVLFVENYQNWLDEITSLFQASTDSVKVVVTARTAVNDVFVDRLIDLIGDGLREVSLDRLDEQDINWFVDTLQEFGLWGEHAGFGVERKRQIISRDCQSEIHAILLRLLKSPDISQRFKAVLDALKKQEEFYRILIGILVTALLNEGLDLDTVADIWGSEVVNNPRFRQNEAVKQFVDFGSGEVRMRSAVAARYVLQHACDASRVVEVLTQMARRTHELSRSSKKYHDLFVGLTRFNSLQMIIPEDGRRSAIIRYFEGIKNLAKNKKNVHFWLQYGIACTVIREFFRAGKYFETAYSICDQRGWDRYQIDNHYARYLLAYAIDSSEPLEVKDYMEIFRKASDIIAVQMRRERMHYPFRVAVLFKPFFEKIGNRLEKSDIQTIDRMCERVLDEIQRRPARDSSHRDVQKCFQALTSLRETIADA